MFRKYGFVGILLIILGQLIIIFDLKSIQLEGFYFILVWLGYILVVDAIVYKIKKHSLIMNDFRKFIGLFLISIVFWWIFEIYNNVLGNWYYLNTPRPEWLFFSLGFSTVVPAMFETFDLLKTIHLVDKVKQIKHTVSKNFLLFFIILGLIFVIYPFLFPSIYAYIFVWPGFFFLLDPINYLHKQPSILKFLNEGKLKIPIILAITGLVCGFFWEFWNYWATPKWYYILPEFANTMKVFEMPLLGYLFYLPFGWSLYAMYYFVVGTLEIELKKLKVIFSKS